MECIRRKYSFMEKLTFKDKPSYPRDKGCHWNWYKFLVDIQNIIYLLIIYESLLFVKDGMLFNEMLSTIWTLI